MEATSSKKTTLTEKSILSEWLSTLVLETPNLLLAYNTIAKYLESLPVCKFAVSLQENLIAIISQDRQLEISVFDEEGLTLRSRLKVLPDRFPEWCLLEWSASGALLLSTRSNAVVDVFDNTGGFCYSLPISGLDAGFDASMVINRIATIACPQEEAKWLDYLYVLQFNSTFSAYKMGRLAGFHPLYKVDLRHRLCTSFALIPDQNLLILSSQYRLVGKLHEKDWLQCTEIGLNVYRIADMEPYLIDVKTVDIRQPALLERVFFWMPFFSIQSAIILCLEYNEHDRMIACISSTGDLFVFNVPGMRCAMHWPHVLGCAKPVQAVWTGHRELTVLKNDGTLTRSKIKVKKKHSESESEKPIELKVETFSKCAQLFAPSFGMLYILECQNLESDEERKSLLRHENKAWLAATLGLSTGYDYVKVRDELFAKKVSQMWVGWMFGQPLEEIQAAIVEMRVRFILHLHRQITTKQLFAKKLKTKEFAAALALTVKHKELDADEVYKRRWKDAWDGHSANLIEEILVKTNDSNWVIEQCVTANCDDHLALQALIGLALKTIKNGEETITNGHQRAVVFHCRRLSQLLDSESMHLYEQLKAMSLLDIAIFLAQTERLNLLHKLLKKNFQYLRSYMLIILSQIPEVTVPVQYQKMLPKNTDELFEFEINDAKSKVEIDVVQLETMDRKPDFKWLYETDVFRQSPEMARFRLNFANVDSNIEIVKNWYRQRVIEIDDNSGLIQNVIAFLELAIQSGFEEFNADLTDAKFYSDLIFLFGAVNLSFQQFHTVAVPELCAAISKRLSETDLLREWPKLLALLEHLSARGRCELVEEMRRFLINNSKQSLRLAAVALSSRPDLVQPLVHDCLMIHEKVGDALLRGAARVNAPAERLEALFILDQHGIRPTYAQLDMAQGALEEAEAMITMLARTATIGGNRSEWVSVKEAANKLSDTIFADVLSHSDMLRILAKTMLMFEPERNMQFLDLILSLPESTKLSVSSDAKNCLSLKESATALLEASQHYSNGARDSRDSQLVLAREILHLTPKSVPAIETELRLLDAIEQAGELGSGLLPVQIRLAEPEQLLADTIRMGKNYKEVKKTAVLAKSLGINRPAERALVLSASEALVRRDERTLTAYIDKLLASPKSPALHSLFVEIIQLGLVPGMHNAMLATMVAICPPDELSEMLAIDRTHRVARNRQAELLRKTWEESDLEEVIRLDQSYTIGDNWKEPDRECSTSWEDVDHGLIDWSAMTIEEAELAQTNLAIEAAHLSSTVAALIGVFAGIPPRRWTRNRALKAYCSALAAHRDSIDPELLMRVPPSVVVENSPKDPEEMHSALDRIVEAGCDRERFLSDSDYRNDSLIGSALTLDDDLFQDCVNLAIEYQCPLWPVYMSSLEFLLTDLTVPTYEIRRKLVARSLLDVLGADQRKLFATLREQVFPLLDGRDHSRMTVYMSLFDAGEPERLMLDAANELSALDPEIDLKAILGGLSTLTKLAIERATSPKQDIPTLRAICAIIRQLPRGAEALFLATETVLEKPPGKWPMLILTALQTSPAAIIGMVDQIEPIDHQISVLESNLATPISTSARTSSSSAALDEQQHPPAIRLRQLMQDRLNTQLAALRTSREKPTPKQRMPEVNRPTSSSSSASPEPANSSYFSGASEESAMVRRRGCGFLA